MRVIAKFRIQQWLGNQRKRRLGVDTETAWLFADRGHDADYAPLGSAGGIERSVKNMQALADLLKARGIALTIVVYPWPAQLALGDHDSRQASLWREFCAGKLAHFRPAEGMVGMFTIDRATAADAELISDFIAEIEIYYGATDIPPADRRLRQIRGLLFGEMVDCFQNQEQGYTLQEVILRVVGDLGIPIGFGLRSGHVSRSNITLPFGVQARLTVGADVKLEILESATVPRKS